VYKKDASFMIRGVTENNNVRTRIYQLKNDNSLRNQSSTSLISNASSKQTLDDILKNSVDTAIEDPVIDQILEEMPENQIVVSPPPTK
jgi:hypothetical protein